MGVHKYFKSKVLLSLALGSILLFSACGSSSEAAPDMYEPYMQKSGYTNESALTGAASMAAAAPAEQGAGNVNTSTPLPSEERKIVLNASVDIETLDYDKSYADIFAAIENSGGSIASSSRQEDQTRARYSHISARIPSNKYSAFLLELKDYGNLLSVSESSEDITSAYLDIAARLSSLHSQMTRLNELVEQASNLEDMILLQSQISSVQYEIEYYSSLQRTYDNQVALSTVEINLQEVKEITKTPESFGSKIASAFSNGLSNFSTLFQWIVLFTIAALPFLVAIAVVVFLLFFVLRGRKKKKGKASLPLPVTAIPPAQNNLDKSENIKDKN